MLFKCCYFVDILQVDIAFFIAEVLILIVAIMFAGKKLFIL